MIGCLQLDLPVSGIYSLLELGLNLLGKFVEDFRSSFANIRI